MTDLKVTVLSLRTMRWCLVDVANCCRPCHREISEVGMKTVYRAETIGSLLRPAYLWNARRSLRSKEMTPAEFKKTEDRAVDEAIALQEFAGLDVVTDGEVRRLSFIGPLSDVVSGLEPMPVNRQWHEGGKLVEFKMGLAVTGKVRRRRSLVTEEFAYARRQAKKPLKV